MGLLELKIIRAKDMKISPISHNAPINTQTLINAIELTNQVIEKQEKPIYFSLAQPCSTSFSSPISEFLENAKTVFNTIGAVPALILTVSIVGAVRANYMLSECNKLQKKQAAMNETMKENSNIIIKYLASNESLINKINEESTYAQTLIMEKLEIIQGHNSTLREIIKDILIKQQIILEKIKEQDFNQEILQILIQQSKIMMEQLYATQQLNQLI